MAAHTTPYGMPIIRTLRIDLPVDVYRRLQMLQMRENAGKRGLGESLIDTLLRALKHGLDDLEPALVPSEECGKLYVPAEALHDEEGTQVLRYEYGSRCTLMMGHSGPCSFNQPDSRPPGSRRD